MTLYLDSSAFVKLYVRETGSSDVIAAVNEGSGTIVTHEIAHIEIRAALASAMRRQVVTAVSWDIAKRKFLTDWQSVAIVHTSADLVLRAAELAEGFALRAYDSLHLAAVEYIYLRGESAVSFACFDKRLNEAARLLGIRSRF